MQKVSVRFVNMQCTLILQGKIRVATNLENIGKPGELREFENVSKSQGKLREIQIFTEKPGKVRENVKYVT